MLQIYIVFGLFQIAAVGAWFRNSPLRTTDIVSRLRPYRDIVASLVALTITIALPSPGLADGVADNQPIAQQKQQQVYFGVGCFWHVQHEFIDTERKVLGRQDSELTV